MPITHDFSRPIPPSTLRISVLWNGQIHATDLPTAKIENTIRAFEDFAGLVLSAHAHEIDDTCWTKCAGFRPNAVIPSKKSPHPCAR
jgi:hypothetical protein